MFKRYDSITTVIIDIHHMKIIQMRLFLLKHIILVTGMQETAVFKKGLNKC